MALTPSPGPRQNPWTKPERRGVQPTNPPGVNTVTKRRSDGTVAVYRYHRASGRRLDGEPGSVEFDASWRDAERAGKHAPATPAQKGGAWAKLIEAYQKSQEYGSLVATTRHTFDKM